MLKKISCNLLAGLCFPGMRKMWSSAHVNKVTTFVNRSVANIFLLNETLLKGRVSQNWQIAGSGLSATLLSLPRAGCKKNPLPKPGCRSAAKICQSSADPGSGFFSHPKKFK
jgi:hypothetical protein